MYTCIYVYISFSSPMYICTHEICNEYIGDISFSFVATDFPNLGFPYKLIDTLLKKTSSCSSYDAIIFLSILGYLQYNIFINVHIRTERHIHIYIYMPPCIYNIHIFIYTYTSLCLALSLSLYIYSW